MPCLLSAVASTSYPEGVLNCFYKVLYTYHFTLKSMLYNILSYISYCIIIQYLPNVSIAST